MRSLSASSVLQRCKLWTSFLIYRVDGEYLRYHYLPGYGANTEFCSDVKHKDDNTTSNNVTYTNDFAALCRHMLSIHKVIRPLWAAMVGISTSVGKTPHANNYTRN